MNKAEMYPNAPPPPYPGNAVDPGPGYYPLPHQQQPLNPGFDPSAPAMTQAHMQYPSTYVIAQPGRGPQHFVGPAGVTVAPTVTVVTIASLGPYPIQMQCSKCRAEIMTTTKSSTGLLTWILAGGLCLIGCWVGCCLIPFCIDGCQDVDHFCPNCRAHIGTYKRL
jgi:lipopolysaccharide-induced tumor necrosis factor-alpha factor